MPRHDERAHGASMTTGRPVARAASPRSGAVEAARRVVAAGGRPARLGAVLGTGTGGLVDRLTDAWTMAAADTGWLVRSTATGHAGRVVCGGIDGLPVVVLQGRVHGYEGLPPESLTRGVELLAALGVRRLLITNAAGGLRPDMRRGELVVLADHVDLVRRPWADSLVPPAQPDDRGTPHPTCYDQVLGGRALGAARRAGATARRGTYAFLSGPNYETRAEYRMLRRIGADVVGMSTVPEVVAAVRLGVGVVACSVVTNVARPDAPESTDAEDVCRVASAATDGMWAVLRELARDLEDSPDSPSR